MTLFEKLRCLFTFGQGVALPLPPINENADPFSLFKLWFDDANSSGVLLPEAMSVSSVSQDGQPSCRMVLLKEFNQDGFIFYTNYSSRKSEELNKNDKIALLFHWNVLQRQIRIEGIVEKISAEQSAKYFHSRDRGSQIGAWSSKQSSEIQTKTELADSVAYYTKKFAGNPVPLPEFWGGWRIKPNYIEFWQGRASRLHDRVCFKQHNNQWKNFKLQP
jgi:pyridoxamine 5'-phosphate oxidase